MEKFFLAAMQMIQGVGSSKLGKLINVFGRGELIWHAKGVDLKKSGCLDERALNNFLNYREQFDIQAFAEELQQKRICLCTAEDEEYPDNLKNIFNPPVVLFYRGNFSVEKKAIAIVGARKASAYGKACAEKLAHDLAGTGVTVVSGAAKGIDTEAHVGALSSGGKTIAVLGCGIDVAYPKENKKLLDEIAEKGVVLSEYGPNVQANAKFFPARNRIISGIAQGVVVIEAAMKSGSLITAAFAVNEGRDVFAVPGSVFSTLNKGCHQLIKQGAKLVENADDVLEEYTWKPHCAIKADAGMSQEERLIYQMLQYDVPMEIDEIVLKTRCNISNIAFILLQMELRGLIVEYAPHSYLRVVKEGVL